MREIDSVKQFRIHQDRERNVEIRVAASPRLAKAERLRIDQGVRTRLGQDLCLRLVEVDHIESLPSGKHRYVVSDAAAEIPILPHLTPIQSRA
jgi:phenylacetate-CoA ligase